MITLTEKALKEIQDGLTQSEELYLRIGVKGGGCSGFSYTFDYEQFKDDDDYEQSNVLIDSISFQYLNNTTIDYIETLMGSQFIIQNPNATGSCGCGSSFTVN